MTARSDPSDNRPDVARTGASLAMWFGMLGGPFAGLLNVMINYPTVDRACVNDSSVILHVLTLLFLAVAIAAGLTAWSIRVRIGDRPSAAGDPLSRARFMTTVGLLTASVSVFGILLQWIPIFFLGACHGT
jgi:heme/copper-type cytochrome/quinol oxidase subunit 1